jgi:3-hydroxybutyryl-CoA dehydrogenase
VQAWAAATGAALVSEAAADLIVVAPLGCDVSEEVALRRLDATRTIGIDPVFASPDFAALALPPAAGDKTKAAARRLLATVPGAITNDSSGLIAQRVTAVMVNLAAEMAQKGIASPADIDTAVTLALGYPRGPFAWADRLGLDTLLQITERLFATTGDPRYRPSPWLRRRARLGLSLEQQ